MFFDRIEMKKCVSGGFMLTFSQLIELNETYSNFCEYEYGEAMSLVQGNEMLDSLEGQKNLKLIDIAYTDEVFDDLSKYCYQITAKYDIEHHKEIYQMTNEKITVTCFKSMSIDELIQSLRVCSFDEWVTCTNWLDYDVVSLFTDGQISIVDLLEKNPTIEKIEIMRNL